MKTKNLLLLIVLISLNINLLNAQRTVALHSATGVKMYSGINPFIDAYTAAQNGDTIYLPGGSFASSVIDKQLFIYGAGYHPDSTVVTLPTLITNDINPGGNADGLMVEGVVFAVATSISLDVSASNMTFRRCRFNENINFQGYATPAGISTGNMFAECLFLKTVELSNTANCLFSNNIFIESVNNSKSNTFKNNIFLRNDLCFNQVNNNEISNNVFIFTSNDWLVGGFYGSNGNVFNNNLMVAATPNYGSNPITSNNYTGVAQADIFVNQTGYAFSYTHNYHLKNPATYPGSDGSQVGIYGGMFPFKTASVPSNPHIQFKSIASETNSAGELQIQIRVQAQNK